MIDLVQEFVEASRQSESEDVLHARFGETISELGYDRFCAWSLVDPQVRPDGSVLLMNYPERWTSHYREREYWRVDPTYRLGMQGTVPFLWTDVVADKGLTAAERQFMREAGDAGLHYGLTVPVRGGQVRPGNVTVYSEDREFDPRATHTLHLLSIYLYEAASRISLDRSKENPYAPLVPLTVRECECIKWAALGKTDWEIGEILGISQSTAHFHIEKAKKKFGVATRTQAVVQAVVTNQIIP